MSTKKVGIAGKFGARYGKSVKDRYRDVSRISKSRHKCPSCLKLGLKRTAPGIWLCCKCGHKMAGKAYKPS
jgi:large subunit ribosomal protein L37Ae